MKCSLILNCTAVAIVFSVTVNVNQCAAQTTHAERISGTWMLLSATVERGEKKLEPYGANPRGTLMLDERGRFALIVTRADLPKFASNNREMGSPEENKAIVGGSNAYFGFYSI